MDNVRIDVELVTYSWGKLTKDDLLVLSGYPTTISSFVDVVTGEQFIEKKLAIPVMLDKTENIIKRFREGEETVEIPKGYISFDTYVNREDVRKFTILSTYSYLVLFLMIIRNMFDLQMTTANVVLNGIPDLVSAIKSSKQSLVSEVINELENDEKYKALNNLIRGSLVFPILYSQIVELSVSFSVYLLDYLGLVSLKGVIENDILKGVSE